MFVLCWGLLPFLLYLGFVGAVWRCWRREKGPGQSDVLEEPLVSVVVPFRNEEKHLPALVAALREQSHPDSLLEFLLVDDGSSDGGPAFLRRELAEKLVPHPKNHRPPIKIQVKNRDGFVLRM